MYCVRRIILRYLDLERLDGWSARPNSDNDVLIIWKDNPLEVCLTVTSLTIVADVSAYGGDILQNNAILCINCDTKMVTAYGIPPLFPNHDIAFTVVTSKREAFVRISRFPIKSKKQLGLNLLLGL